MIKKNNIPIILLIGGKGERFDYKENIPKHLVKINKKPFLITLLDYYFSNNFHTFFFPLGHKIDQYIKFFKNINNIKKYNLNILNKNLTNINLKKKNIFLFNAKKSSNKLQRILKTLKYIKNNSIVGACYGDTIANINFKKNLALLKNKQNKASLVCYKTRSPYGVIKINNRYVKKFIEKPMMKDPVNIGFYFFKKEIFNNKFNTTKDLETFLLPKLAKNKNLISFLHNKKHYTVNNEKDLIYLKKQVKNKKIF
jgi:NDP-sugar pyrophosphorylase family protein